MHLLYPSGVSAVSLSRETHGAITPLKHTLTLPPSEVVNLIVLIAGERHSMHARSSRKHLGVCLCVHLNPAGGLT